LASLPGAEQKGKRGELAGTAGAAEDDDDAGYGKGGLSWEAVLHCVQVGVWS